MTLDLKDMKVAALVNVGSGRCTAGSGAMLEGQLKRHGIRPASLWTGHGHEIERALDAAMASRPDLMVVLGGDGTLRGAAERCGADGPLLMALPGGTMNLLPRAIYGQKAWRAVLAETAANPAIRRIDGAEADGRLFFAGGMLGGPTLLAEAREAVRAHALASAAGKGLAVARTALARELDVDLGDGKPAKGEVVAISCPLFAEGKPKGEAARIEVAVVDVEGTLDALRLVLIAAFRDWRADAHVRRALAAEIEVRSGEPIPGLLDGEAFTFTSPLTVRAVTGAFRAVVPGA